MEPIYGTTILSVRRGNQVVVIGDGQVTQGNTVMKGTARKVRRLYNNRVITGFAGSTADAFTLFERFDAKLKDYNGNLQKAAVELAKDWRTDKSLRQLEAMLLVVDKDHGYIISGNGDVIEPEGGTMGIGSGSPFALAAARALLAKTDLSALEIGKTAMEIASEMCIYTNKSFTIEEITSDGPANCQ